MAKFYHWLFLFLAIFLGVLGASLLKLSQGFTRLVPTVLMFVTYLLCGWLFSLAIKTIDLGLAYAIWSGLGTALVVIIGVACFSEHITLIKGALIIVIIAAVIGLCVANTVQQ